MRRTRRMQFCLVLFVFAGLLGLGGHRTAAQTTCVRFNETNHTICGRFLQYWTANGGLAQQGYPISEQVSEKSDTDGKTYQTQYFERAVFEMHPENQQPYDVLLALLGVFEYNGRYGSAGAPNQTVSNAPGAVKFNETGHTVGGKFLTYWQQHGGLAQQGYPISDEFQEKSALDGKTYTVQYFQRAVFELHPENAPPYDVLLSQLGKFYYDRKHAVSPPGATSTPLPVATSTPVPLPPANARIGETVRRNGMAFTVPSVDIGTKGLAVHFVLTDESAGAVSFVLANADQHLVGVRKEYDKTEPDRREQVSLNNGQSYTGATGFRADFKTGPEKAVTYIIDNLPGIGSVHIDVPINLP